MGGRARVILTKTESRRDRDIDRDKGEFMMRIDISRKYVL